MRQILVAGNWKLNGSTEFTKDLIQGVLSSIDSVKKVEVAIFPPHIYLQQVSVLLAGSAIVWGAQNVSEQESGAYTGEVSAGMLTDFGCKYVVIGHSERRALYGESDQLVAEKFVAVQSVGMIPILCVGELLAEREAGDTEQVVARQLDAVIGTAGVEALRKAVIAYEPVWAIGTGKTATPEQAQQVHAFIRNRILAQNSGIANGVQILYGGSVKPDNAKELFACEDIDGGLIGGAALQVDSFMGICTAAN